MKPRSAGAIASAGSLLGLAIGLSSQFFPGQLEALCADNTACVSAFDEPVLGLAVGAWVLGIFLGLTWASVSLCLGRKGYAQSGQNLLLMGISAMVFFGVLLRAEGGCTPCHGALAGAALVAIGGFLGRKEGEEPDRAIGAMLAALALVVLSTGTIAQSRSLTQPWSDLKTAPTLTGKEAVLSGSASASRHKVLLYADFSDPAADRALSALLQINKDHKDAIRLFFKPLALEKGMPISMGFHCAKQRGASETFVRKMLAYRGYAQSARRDDAAVNALALKSGFQQLEFLACFEDESARKQLAADTLVATKAGFEGPYTVLVESDEGWKKLNSARSIGDQITKLLGLTQAEE
jgi:hypothetical protein